MIHSLRHTMLTRLGESGVDVLTTMKIAGHSSVTVSEKYVHGNCESTERAFLELHEFSRRAIEQPPATVSASAASFDAEGPQVDEKRYDTTQSLSHCAPVAQVDRATVS